MTECCAAQLGIGLAFEGGRGRGGSDIGDGSDAGSLLHHAEGAEALQACSGGFGGEGAHAP